MLHWIHNPALAFDPFPGRRSDASGKRPNAVRVGLARGRRVASGPNQVYHRGHHARLRVQFSVDGGAGPKAVATSSTTESATFDPVWCETFELPYAEPGAPSVFGAAPASTASLTMTVEGREADADEFTRMGSCTLLLESLRKAPPRRWYALDGDRGELDLLLDWRYASRCDPFKRDGKTGNTPMKRLVEAVGPVGTSPAGHPRGQSRKISRRGWAVPRDGLVSQVAMTLDADEVEMSLVASAPLLADAFSEPNSPRPASPAPGSPAPGMRSPLTRSPSPSKD